MISSRWANAFRVGTNQVDTSNLWARMTLSTQSIVIFSIFFIAVTRIFWNCHIVASLSTDTHSCTVSGSLWDSLRKETRWNSICSLLRYIATYKWNITRSSCIKSVLWMPSRRKGLSSLDPSWSVSCPSGSGSLNMFANTSDSSAKLRRGTLNSWFSTWMGGNQSCYYPSPKVPTYQKYDIRKVKFLVPVTLRNGQII